MDKSEQLFSIPKIDRETNFWMLRTKRGFFFDEFLEKEYIAIGWNAISKSIIDKRLTKSRAEALKAFIKEVYGESKPGTALNKCIRFCYELKENDIVVIVDNSRVAFAYIGEYFEESASDFTSDLEKEIHAKIAKSNHNIDKFDCPYLKRRKISVIKVLGVDDALNPYLQSAIARNWHSLSGLNDYAEFVLSGCFDTYIFRDKLTVTFRVRTNKAINVLDLSNFVLYAAKFLSDDHPEKVRVKTTLHSPGDIILQVWDFVQKNALPLLMCYMAVFGGKVGNYEFNSIIGIIKGAVNSNYEKKKKDIELRKLQAEADLAEQQAIEKELGNIKTIRDLQLSSVDSYAKPLAAAAVNLEVQPSSATIADIEKIITARQEEQPQE